VADLVEFRVEGVTSLRRDLRKFAPDLAKDLNRALGAEGRKVVADARALVPGEAPLSGWSRGWLGLRPFWDGNAARKGIRLSTAAGRRSRRGGFTSIVAILQKDRAGAVFEFAGRNSGNAMGSRLTVAAGPASRVVWRAVDARRPEIAAAVRVAVERAAGQLSARIAADRSGA